MAKKIQSQSIHRKLQLAYVCFFSVGTVLSVFNSGCVSSPPKVVQISEDGKTFTLQLSKDPRSLVASKARKDALEAHSDLQKRKDLSTALLNSVAELSLLGGSPDQAGREALALLKSDLKNVSAMKTLVKVSLSQSRYEQAILLVNNALLTHPREADFYCLRGLAHYFLNQPLDSREDWKKALTIDPTNIPAQMNLAALYFQNRNIALAGAGFERVIALQPQNLDAQVGRALVTSASGGFEEARRTLLEVVKDSPKNPLVLINLAMLERDRFANYQAALDYTERYLEVAGADRLGVERAVADREELRQLVTKKAQKMSDEQLRQLASKSNQRMQSATEEKSEPRNTAMANDVSEVHAPSKASKNTAASGHTKKSDVKKQSGQSHPKDLGSEDASALEDAIK